MYIIIIIAVIHFVQSLLMSFYEDFFINIVFSKVLIAFLVLNEANNVPLLLMNVVM